jgi:NADPH-dependent glutamate synthase beta subunit-like oxidoreductase/ferredoxin
MKAQTMNKAKILTEARQLLEAGKPDEAIDILRVSQSNEDAELSALLAHCYFNRGDAKGDVHSSTFFATRAIALGYSDNDMQAICAIGEFRKENYPKAAANFAEYVTDQSGAATKYTYGLALLYSNQHKAAIVWLQQACEATANNEYCEALELARSGKDFTRLEPSAPIPPVKNLGGLWDKRPAIDAPYKSNALSKLAGYASEKKDFNWLERSIPCQKSCPAHTDIPGYLSEIYKGNFRQAYEINLRDNVFPGVLGRVCARPCESSCRHGRDDLGESVAICFSKRSAHDLKINQRPVVMNKLFDDTGKSIAIIGGGPAGLATARELALFGHQVKVYEKYSRPGGMMVQGIPVFRLPRDIVGKEITQITELGVQLICDCEIGKDIKLQQLINDNDAVIMAAGTFRQNLLDLPGAELKGIKHGLEYLLEVNDKNDGVIGKNVIVIGGGFTAMDCARTAKRLGTKLNAADNTWQQRPLNDSGSQVNVFYRRSEDEMLVTPGEVEELHHEGIGMEFLISPLEYLGDEKGNLKSVRFIRNELGEPDASGRRRPVAIEGSEFEVPADLLLLATGQFPDTAWIDDKLKSSLIKQNGWLENVGDHGTTLEKLFISGDFATGAQSLIEAIAHGKAAALDVDTFLMGECRMETVAEITDAPLNSERIIEMNDVPRETMPTLPLEQRNLNAEVETGYPAETGVDEAQRCYQCNLKYEIDPDKCIYCDWCIKAKSRPECIVRAKNLQYSDNGEIIGYETTENTEDTSLIYINQEDCIRCNLCVEACPVDAISVQRVSLKQIKCGGCGIK